MAMSKWKREQVDAWWAAVQAGREANKDKVLKNLAKGRVWDDQRRSKARDRAKAFWTPVERSRARERALAYQAKVKAALEAAEKGGKDVEGT